MSTKMPCSVSHLRGGCFFFPIDGDDVDVAPARLGRGEGNQRDVQIEGAYCPFHRPTMHQRCA